MLSMDFHFKKICLTIVFKIVLRGIMDFFSIPSASEKEIALHFSFPLDGVGGGDRRLHSAQKIE